MTKLKSINLKRLLKLEVPQFTNGVIRIVEKHNAKTLMIDGIFDLLVKQKPQLNFLEVSYGSHPLTKEIASMCRERTKYVISITTKMRSISRADMGAVRDDEKILQPFVTRYLNNLGKKDKDVVSEVLTQFFQQIDRDEAIEDAFTALGFSAYLDELRSVNSSLMESIDLRMGQISERPKEDIPTIVKTLNVAVQDLLIQIRLARLQNKELDYTSLVHELNIILTTYGQKINKREGINKKKAESIVVKVKSDYSPEITQKMISFDVMNEDDLVNVDKKKTVAMSTITERLPIVSTKA